MTEVFVLNRNPSPTPYDWGGRNQEFIFGDYVLVRFSQYASIVLDKVVGDADLDSGKKSLVRMKSPRKWVYTEKKQRLFPGYSALRD